MEKSEFITKYKEALQEFSRMSQDAGSYSDYVQGGGGNTSCKLDDQLMVIKASGFRLDQITEDNAYAVLDYRAIRSFYRENDPNQLDDVEKAGSARTKESIVTVNELPQLRPSVEAGFHALLEKFVLHTHPIYANLATCSAQGREIAARALADLPEKHVFVPYINPGAQLTFAIAKARQEAVDEHGSLPVILFMENHGLVITGNDADVCLRLNDKVNQRLAAAFSVSRDDWPEVSLEKTQAGTETVMVSRTNWLKSRLLQSGWDLDIFVKQALYPDQLVFLAGQLDLVSEGTWTDYAVKPGALPAKATIFTRTGEVIYRCGLAEAKTIEETLCAVLFIHDTIKKAGYIVRTMDEAGKDFISNWESEKYRKQVAEKE